MADQLPQGFVPDNQAPPQQATAAPAGFIPDAQSAAAPQEAAPEGFIPDQKEAPDFITNEELQGIADKHGVKVEDLKPMVGWYGGYTEPDPRLNTGEATKQILTESLRNSGGYLNDVALGLPGFAYKKAQSGPMQHAMDDIRDLVESKESTGEYLMRQARAVAIPGAGALRGAEAGVEAAGEAARTLGQKAVEYGTETAKSAAIGAGAGLGQSKTGEELQGAGTGALVGAGLHVAGDAGARLILGKSGDAEAEVAKQYEKLMNSPEGRDIQARTVQVAEDAKPRTDEMRALILPEENSDALTDFDAFKEQISDSEADKLVEGFDQEKDADLAKLLDKSDIPEEQYTQYKAFKEAQDTTREFAKFLDSPEIATFKGATPSIEEALETIAEKRAQQGEDFIDREFDRYTQGKIASQILTDDLATKVGRPASFINKMKSFLLDGKFAYGLIDDRLGTSGEQTLDDLSQQFNKYNVLVKGTNKDVDTLTAKAAKADISGEDITKAIRSGSTANLSPEQTSLVDAVKQGFEDRRLLANELGGVEIAKRENYIPEHMVSTPEAIVRMNTMVGRIEDQTGIRVDNAISDEQWKALRKNVDFNQLRDGVAFMQGGKMPESPSDFIAGLRRSLDPTTSTALAETRASSLLARTGEIPEFLKEQDALKLMKGWTEDTFRHLYMRDGIAELRNIRNIAANAGDMDAAEYIHRHIQDLTGLRPNTLNALTKNLSTQLSVAAANKAAAATNPVTRGAMRVLQDTPEIMASLHNNIYANALGLSPHAIMFHLTHPLFMSVPELGYGYGTKKITGALVDLSRTIAAGEEAKLSPEVAQLLGKEAGETVRLHNPALILMNEGYAGPKFSQEIESASGNGIRNSALYRMPQEAIDKWNHFAMWGFEKSDQVIRMVSRNMGEQVAEDLFGSRAWEKAKALQFVNNMGSGPRREVRAALVREDQDSVKDIVTKYLNSKTVLNYDRIHMSEFGRTMGPLFSVFTKWPTHIAGDVTRTLINRGAIKGGANIAYRYLGPLMAAMSINSMLGQVMDPETAKRLFGKEGVAHFSPLVALRDIAEGKVIKPPSLSSISDLAAGLVLGNPKALQHWMNNATQSFMPGAGGIRFLTDDMPIYGHMFGLRIPEASGTFIEKTEKLPQQYQNVIR